MHFHAKFSLALGCMRSIGAPLNPPLFAKNHFLVFVLDRDISTRMKLKCT